MKTMAPLVGHNRLCPDRLDDREPGQWLHRLVLATLLALAGVASADATADALDIPAGRYALDETHAYITFSYSHLGFSTPHLGFNEFAVAVTLDPQAPAQSTLDVTIDAASIDSRVDKFDDILRGSDFFDVEAHPVIRFSAANIEMTGSTTAKIDGTLTIKGIAKPVTLDARIERAAQHPMLNKPVLGVSAFAEVSRSDWGLGKYAPAVGDTVSLYITAELVHQSETP